MQPCLKYIQSNEFIVILMFFISLFSLQILKYVFDSILFRVHIYGNFYLFSVLFPVHFISDLLVTYSMINIKHGLVVALNRWSTWERGFYGPAPKSHENVRKTFSWAWGKIYESRVLMWTRVLVKRRACCTILKVA